VVHNSFSPLGLWLLVFSDFLSPRNPNYASITLLTMLSNSFLRPKDVAIATAMRFSDHYSRYPVPSGPRLAHRIRLLSETREREKTPRFCLTSPAWCAVGASLESKISCPLTNESTRSWSTCWPRPPLLICAKSRRNRPASRRASQGDWATADFRRSGERRVLEWRKTWGSGRNWWRRRRNWSLRVEAASCSLGHWSHCVVDRMLRISFTLWGSTLLMVVTCKVCYSLFSYSSLKCK